MSLFFQSWFPATDEEILELYENQNGTETAFVYQPKIAETELLEKLDAMSKILYEKLHRLEDEIDNAKEIKMEPNEIFHVANDGCTLCSASVVIIAIKLLVILLV